MAEPPEDVSRAPPADGEEPRKEQHKCCLVSFDTPSFIGGRQVRRAPGRRRAELRFRMLASFRNEMLPSLNPVTCSCSCCEYRQDVRGFFKYDGEELPFPLAGGQLMDKLEWREDGMRRRIDGVERDIHYGHRDQPPSGLVDAYAPTRAFGCSYEGMDAPFLAGRPGAPFEIDLDFRGRIIDTCTGATVVTKTWGFRMKGLLSRRRELWE